MISFPFDTPPAEGEAIEVADGILWMRIPLPMALDHVNVYALKDTEGWTIVDTGINSSRTRAVWETLKSGPLRGDPITRVILTHHHPDHVGLAGLMADEGAEIVTSLTAYLTARMLTLDEQDRPPAKTVAFWRACGMDVDLLDKRTRGRPFNFCDVVALMPLGFTRLQAGDTLHAAGRVWDVRTGHGHAPEHLTFWSREDDLVIGGDQFLPGISPHLGVYPTLPEADPVGEWLASCRAFEAHANPEQLILCGHKLPFRGLPMRLKVKISNHLNALDRLRAHLAQPCTGGDCFLPVFGRDIPATDGAYGLALSEAIGHLNHLLAAGEVSRETRPDGVWEWRLR